VGRFVTCAHAHPSRCSIATVWIVSVPAAPHLLRASSSRNRAWRSLVRLKRTRFARVVALSRLAASVLNAARHCSRAAMPTRGSCPFAFLRWITLRSFSRCWTFGRPAHNRGFALARQFHSILSYPNSATCTCCLTLRSRRMAAAPLNSDVRFHMPPSRRRMGRTLK
jgi:hypothetical protein